MVKPQKEPYLAFSGYIWAALLAASQLITSLFGFSAETLVIAIFGSALFFFLLIRSDDSARLSDYELYGIVGLVTIATLTQQIHHDSGLIRFIWDGLIQHYDINPFTTVPSSGDVMGLQSEPIFPYIGQTNLTTPFSPFLLILAKFSGLIYLSSGFSVSILTTKFFWAVLTVTSVFWGYAKGIFSQSLLLILLLNPFTLFMIAQGQPLLMLFPVLVLALYLWEMQDELMFWLIWGIIWFLSPVGILISILFIYRSKGLSLIGIVTYSLWWIPFASVENLQIFLEQSLFLVPDITLLSSLLPVSEFISQTLFYISYLTLIVWAVWYLKNPNSPASNILLLTIPLFLLPSDISALLIITITVSYLLTEINSSNLSHNAIVISISFLTSLLTLLILADGLSLYYSVVILIQVLILITLIFLNVAVASDKPVRS